jgi:DNA-binding winged helix-turn-helix (wHTH) protein
MNNMSRDAQGPLAQCPEWAPGAPEGVYSFDTAELDPQRRVLRIQSRQVPLTARAFDLLLLLIRNRHRSLTRAELMQHLWPNVCVEDGNLSVNISQLRKALANPGYIVTLPRHGYRFAGDVKVRSLAEVERVGVMRRTGSVSFLR